jgi:porin
MKQGFKARRPGSQLLSLLCFAMLSVVAAAAAQAQTPEPNGELESSGFGGPDATANRLATDREQTDTPFDLEFLRPWYEWKDGIREKHGLAFGSEYNAIYLKASDSLPGTDKHAAGGIFRFRGEWEAFGRGTDHPGSLMFLVEHTHDLSDTLPNSFLSENLGYVGISNIPTNDEGWRLNTLYWDQKLQGGEYEFIAGYLDISDYLDVYPLTSPWTDFSNYAFSIGAGALDLTNDASLGLAGAAWLTDAVYVMAGFVDQNSDATDPLDGFNTFFDESEFFKHFEIGWTGASKEAYFLNNVHLTLWHSDEREELGIEDGWGGVLSFNHALDDHWLVFARTGWSEDGGSLLERSVSIGGGYTPDGLESLGAGSQLGFGAHWGQPNDALFGANLDDQYAAEVYFRWQVADEIAITPSVQLLIDPALNPDEDHIWVGGLRMRVAF